MVKGVVTSIITVAVLMGSLVACGGSEEFSKDEKSDLIVLCAALNDNRNCAEEAKILGALISEKNLDIDCAQEEYLILVGEGGSALYRDDQILIEELCSDTQKPNLEEIAKQVSSFIETDRGGGYFDGYFQEMWNCSDFRITGKKVGLAQSLEWGECNDASSTIRFFSFDASENQNWRDGFIDWARSGEYGAESWCFSGTKIYTVIMTGPQFGLWSLNEFPIFSEISIWEFWKGLTEHLEADTAYHLEFNCEAIRSLTIDSYEAGR